MKLRHRLPRPRGFDPMNFLAHLYLADPTPASRIGNLLPDLCRVRPGMELDAEVAAGVRRHRRIDAFTDRHPAFLASRARVFDRCGRFSGIVVDVLYDHVLTRKWDRYCDTPLPRFVDEVHEHLRTHADLAPPEVRGLFARLSNQSWLLSYDTPDGLRLCFRRMSARFSERFGREVSLESAVEALEDHGAGLTADFDAFFPELVSFVRNEPV